MVIRVVHSFSENASLEAIDLSSVDLFWTEPLEFRYRAFAALRQQDPIRFFAEPEIEGLPPGAGYWALTRHADVVEASRRTDAFCSGKGTNIPDLPPAFLEFYGSMINLDDPRHARLRRLVSGGFTPRMMRELDIGIDVTTTEIVDAAAEKGSCDFVVDVAARLPLAIICDLMGIEAERRDEVFELSNVVLSQGDPEYVPEGVDPLVAFLEAGAGLAEIMKDTAELRRGGNGEDLTSVLVNAEVDGERLTEDELASFFVLLCVAGNETTRNATAWGLQLLTENPEQRDRWLADLDGVLPTAVEEIVRMASPVIHFR
ncbi:MAG TPA: cytochrome P450, partial [Acidimicrobiaceae bacterium]|nr:cytochrome P450 [Acidimicrobiaceae bacterium]